MYVNFFLKNEESLKAKELFALKLREQNLKSKHMSNFRTVYLDACELVFNNITSMKKYFPVVFLYLRTNKYNKCFKHVRETEEIASFFLQLKAVWRRPNCQYPPTHIAHCQSKQYVV